MTPGLIHNTYPDIADEIRKEAGRSTEQRLKAKVAELEDAEVGLRKVRADLAQANADIARLASLNESLREEVATLKAAASGKVVSITGRTRPT